MFCVIIENAVLHNTLVGKLRKNVRGVSGNGQDQRTHPKDTYMKNYVIFVGCNH